MTVDYFLSAVEDLTLRDALAPYYSAHPNFTPWYDCKSNILKKTLCSHDISHTIYACPTTLLGELRVQFWNTFGSFVPKKTSDIIAALSDKETRALLAQPGTLRFFFKNWREALKVRRQTKLMLMKWRFFEEERYLNQTVGSIRKKFNIQILT